VLSSDGQSGPSSDVVLSLKVLGRQARMAKQWMERVGCLVSSQSQNLSSSESPPSEVSLSPKLCIREDIPNLNKNT
jgi:hypothetical protein